MLDFLIKDIVGTTPAGFPIPPFAGAPGFTIPVIKFTIAGSMTTVSCTFGGT